MRITDNLRLLLFPFSLIFWMGLFIRKFVYKSNLLRKVFQINVICSKIPVICVGNIRVGGTGKTQIVLSIAQKLIDKNFRVAILSRGYKRKSKGFLEVDSFDYEKFGDEPVLIKRNLNSAKVFVSENRSLAIEKLNATNKFDFILLDDGLQNLSIKKDYSIVLIDENFFSKNLVENLLLPAGNLREPKTKLKDYDCLIFNKKFENVSNYPLNHKKLFFSEYRFEGFRDLEGREVEMEKINNQNAGIFCGIAQPKTFVKLMEKIGILYKFSKFFPDHYNYDVQDLKILLKFVEKFGCYHLITTEKDIVRLSKFKDEFKRAGVFLLYAKITAKIKNEENLLQDIICLIKK